MITVNGKQVQIEKFPNGESRFVLNFKPSKDVFVNWKYESDSDFFVLNMLDEYIKNHNTFSEYNIYCVINSMPYERMDRSENGSVFSLRLAVALLPSNWSYRALGVHSDITTQLLNMHTNGKASAGDIHGYLFEDAQLTLFHLSETGNVLVFPDKGASDRYARTILMSCPFDIEKFVYGEKVRDFDTGKITGLRLVDSDGSEIKSLHGYSAIVVDDLSSYGGTFIRVHNLLKDLGALESHLFLEKAEDSILKGDLLDCYDSIHTTDLMMNIQSDSFSNPNLIIKSSNEIIGNEFRLMKYEAEGFI